MNINNIKIIFLILLFILIARDASAEDFRDVMTTYDCVYKSFSEQNLKNETLGKDVEFTDEGVGKISSMISGPMRSALIDAANKSIAESNINVDATVDPKKYLDIFINNLQYELFSRVNVNMCKASEDTLRSLLFDVGVNRYFSKLIGRGKFRQWYANNGGLFVFTGFTAAMVSLNLVEQKVNMDDWKKFHIEYVRKFTTAK